jgi:hypothetical protein
MTEAELLAEVELRESQCDNSTVAHEQKIAMDYYLGKPYGTEEEGRSRIISSDVWDAVEGLTPLVLKPFVSSDDIVRFSPQGPEDEEAADQESDYINFVVTQKNDVFDVMAAWVKTGLLQKNGIVKYWWEKSKRTRIERYEGLEDDVYASLLDDDSVEVIEHTEHPGEAPQPGMPPDEMVEAAPTHDVVLRITEEHGEPRYCVIPPEEFRVSRDATSSNPKNARFVEHATRKTISELREMGHDVEDSIADEAAGMEDPRLSEIYAARRSTEDQFRDQTNDPSAREVLFREALTYVDFDGDGIAELRKICIVGKTILSNEETEEINFCGWTPYPQPFQFYGRCPADETTEIQLIKSTVLRQTMDNIYTINNNTRYVSSKVNLDDMLDNQIAGIVRVDGEVVSNHVMPGAVTPIGQVTLPMIEYFDRASETRTGFSRYNAGTDADSLNKTAHGIQIIKEAGDERVGLMSRCFAEQGLKALMLGIHGLCRRHSTKQEQMRLRGKWVAVDPRGWKTRYDMSVSVGLGTSDKQQQMQGAQLLLQTQSNLMQFAPMLVQPKNFYEAGAMLTKSLGEKNVDKFFSAPPEQPAPPPDPTQDPAFKLQLAELHLKNRELDIKEATAQANAANQEATTALKAELQGHDMSLQIMQAMAAMQQQLHTMQTGQTEMAAKLQAQQHGQQMAEAQHQMGMQGQEHSQGMDMAQQSLAEQQAQQAAEQTESADGQA